MYCKIFKRINDIVLSVIGLLVLSPVFLIIAIAIKICDHGPVFFKQKRVGINRTYFTIYKFRSMRVDTPEIPTHLLKNPEQYISRIGRFLRKSSLDELPQLINILSSKMTIVGPRPALWNEYDLIKERDKYGANDIKPGLTGWAQINGREKLEIPIKAKFDGEYIEKMSFLFDCKCFFKTIAYIIKKCDNVDETQKTSRKKIIGIKEDV